MKIIGTEGDEPKPNAVVQLPAVLAEAGKVPNVGDAMKLDLGAEKEGKDAKSKAETRRDDRKKKKKVASGAIAAAAAAAADAADLKSTPPSSDTDIQKRNKKVVFDAAELKSAPLLAPRAREVSSRCCRVKFGAKNWKRWCVNCRRKKKGCLGLKINLDPDDENKLRLAKQIPESEKAQAEAGKTDGESENKEVPTTAASDMYDKIKTKALKAAVNTSPGNVKSDENLKEDDSGRERRKKLRRRGTDNDKEKEDDSSRERRKEAEKDGPRADRKVEERSRRRKDDIKEADSKTNDKDNKKNDKTDVEKDNSPPPRHKSSSSSSSSLKGSACSSKHPSQQSLWCWYCKRGRSGCVGNESWTCKRKIPSLFSSWCNACKTRKGRCYGSAQVVGGWCCCCFVPVVIAVVIMLVVVVVPAIDVMPSGIVLFD